MSRHVVHADDAPAAVGPYSHAVKTSGMVYLSGQAPLDPATGKLIEGDVVDETRRVFENLSAVLNAAGLTFDDVVKVNVYLTDLADFTAMNQVYSSTFSEPFPARTTVEVAGLPLDARVEIELVAQA